MDLAITERVEGDVRVGTLVGDIDVMSAPALRDWLDRRMAGAPKLVLDLQGVTFLDSTGLGILVGRLRLVRLRGGRMSFVCTVPRLLRILSITGLDTVFELYPDVESAIEGCQASESA